jgi:hypothetical protein
VHSPELNGISGQPMLQQVMDALAEVAFEAEFLPSRIEKERKAVVAEAQVWGAAGRTGVVACVVAACGGGRHVWAH